MKAISDFIIRIALADLGGHEGRTPPLGVQILSISCSFQENLACSRPPWRVHAPPPRENPGSATGLNHCEMILKKLMWTSMVQIE